MSPEAPNRHDGLGDAYRAAVHLDEARASDERAVELATNQGQPALPRYRANLEQVIEEVDGPGRRVQPDPVSGPVVRPMSSGPS